MSKYKILQQEIEKSNLTTKDFCTKHGLNYNTTLTGLSRYNRKNKKPKPKPIKPKPAVVKPIKVKEKKKPITTDNNELEKLLNFDDLIKYLRENKHVNKRRRILERIDKDFKNTDECNMKVTGRDKAIVEDVLNLLIYRIIKKD